MARATLNWSLPTTRADGSPLDAGDIAGTEMRMSADGGNNSRQRRWCSRHLIRRNSSWTTSWAARTCSAP